MGWRAWVRPWRWTVRVRLGVHVGPGCRLRTTSRRCSPTPVPSTLRRRRCVTQTVGSVATSTRWSSSDAQPVGVRSERDVHGDGRSTACRRRRRRVRWSSSTVRRAWVRRWRSTVSGHGRPPRRRCRSDDHSITAVFTDAGRTSTSSTSDAITQTVIGGGHVDGGELGSINPSVFGGNVTFTATVTADAPSTATPAGSVEFSRRQRPGSPVALVGGCGDVHQHVDAGGG